MAYRLTPGTRTTSARRPSKFWLKVRPIGDLMPLGLAVPPPESAVGRGASTHPSDRARAGVGEQVLVQLCHEDVKTSCCTEDEGGPFGAARSGGGFKLP